MKPVNQTKHKTTNQNGNCKDLKQIADRIGGGVPEYLSSNPPQGKHNALTDARWTKAMHEHILNL